MKPPTDQELHALLQSAATHPTRTAWIQSASRGIEARVLARLQQPPSWLEAFSALSSWRPALLASALCLLTACWVGTPTFDTPEDETAYSLISDNDTEAEIDTLMEEIYDEAEL